REWRELHRQLRLLCEELGWDTNPGEDFGKALLSAPAALPAGADAEARRKATRGEQHRAARLAREGKKSGSESVSPRGKIDSDPGFSGFSIPDKVRVAAYQALHRAILAGLPTQVGHRTDKGDFQAPRQRRFHLFPGSVLAKKPPPW